MVGKSEVASEMNADLAVNQGLTQEPHVDVIEITGKIKWFDVAKGYENLARSVEQLLLRNRSRLG